MLPIAQFHLVSILNSVTQSCARMHTVFTGWATHLSRLVRSVVVAHSGEILPGERKIVSIGSREVAVFNIDGEYYALRNRCPHQGAPLCTGILLAGLRSSRPGAYDRGQDVRVIRCPWHGWEFDVRTGKSWFDPQRHRVRSYPAGERDVVPDAETYPVQERGRYVVVDI